MAKFIVTESRLRDGLACALCEQAGIDPRYVRRLVLDLEAGSAGKLYLELLVDEDVLDVKLSEMGIHIEAEEAAQNEA